MPRNKISAVILRELPHLDPTVERYCVCKINSGQKFGPWVCYFCWRKHL